METKELIRQEEGSMSIIVTISTINTYSVYSCVLVNLVSGVECGRDVFDTKNKLNNHIARYNMAL